MKKKSDPTTKFEMILDTFRLFFTDEILDYIVLHTNAYAKRCFEENKRFRQDSNTTSLDSREWKLVDRTELE